MAARAVPVQSRRVHFEFWERFRDEVRRQVRDVNAVAGDVLWTVAEGAGPRPWVSVAGTASNHSRAACSFDADAGLTITISPEYSGGGMALEWTVYGAVAAGGREYDPAGLAARFLDELPYDEPYANPGIERNSGPLDQRHPG